ncbi:acyltransferase family protein [Bacillus luti]|uniref:acyltransferase family protein n=1 Tax=Bacillus luti TaxID=2026191 RepID=UPI00142E9DFE|nr:acyltransferase [Bacillus luti]
MVKGRDVRIDALRFIGTVLVIFAHVGAPNWIQNIRTFDVVMLVLISGMSINKSRNTGNYPIYLYGRLKKMILPLYTVLTIIFLINFIFSALFGISSAGIDLNVALRSYLLLDGIGYVWIVRVFLCVALVAPLFPKIFKDINLFRFSFIMVALYLVYSAMSFLMRDTQYWMFELFFIQVIPYIIVAAIGYKLYSDMETKKFMLLLSVTGLIGITIVNAFLNKTILPDYYKYPPQLQYLFYGLFVSLLLFVLVEKYKNIERAFSKKFITFISVHSYDIYVYHILAIFVYNALRKIVTVSIPNEYIVKYIFVLGSSILLVIVKKYLINYFSKIVIRDKLKKVIS